MRVIAGSAGGFHLAVPKSGVRPTMDRVKAAIFSSLGDAIIGQKILDLFAGSGALGIEALSRGSASAVFVDEDRHSIAVIEKNLAKTKLEGRVRQEDVFEFLRRSAGKDTFKIIFADPPYGKSPSQAGGGERFTEKLLADEALPQLLEPEGIFVLEKQPSETLPEMKQWHILRQKTYGATEVLFMTQSGPSRTGIIRNQKSEIG